MALGLSGYAARAATYWGQTAPASYLQIPDREAFFTDLGDQISDQVHQIVRHLEAQLPQDLPPADRMGQMRVIRMQAEEVALNDLLYPLVTPETWGAQELNQMLNEMPDTDTIKEAIQRILEQLEEDRVQFNSPRLLPSEQEQELLDFWNGMLTAMVDDQDPYDLDPEEVQRRTEAVRPYHDRYLDMMNHRM